METALNYLLNASGGIVLFFLVYWLFLRNETFHVANRWFLVASLCMATILPLIPVQYEVLVEAADGAKTGAHTIADTFKNIPVFNNTDESTTHFGWQQAVLLIYLTGAAIFLLRLLTQTFILIHLMIKHRVTSLNGMRVVENQKYGLPFSFFNIVFINPKFHTQDDLPEILAHEKVHIRENHWFDLLFIELLTVIFWFNPFIWLFERAIKQNHEYLADKGVLAQGHTVGRYQALLVNQLMGMQIIGITNNLNFALSTNRLKMMTKKKTSARRLIRFTWALPALALLLFAFAEPQYHYTISKTDIVEREITGTSGKEAVKISGLVVDEDGKPMSGVSVVIRGTTVGTVSDIDGSFKLEVPENASIIISFVGKRTLADTYSRIITGNKKDEFFNRKYTMEDEVIYASACFDMPTPPPPPQAKTKSLAPPPPPPAPPIGTVEKTKLKDFEKEKEVFFVVDDLPEFPGGSNALTKFVQNKTEKYNLIGKAKIAFTVNPKGKVTDVKIVETDNDKLGKAAAEIISQLPTWEPGKQRGKPVPVKYLIAVEFK
ncbi:M56 family metallopeptidase [Draconibacterium halophilum]|uniref:TonB family protein n=1 Tax=Draconibacterium halophilum TaxID=2706887 RepID=A0A6C0R923_9BACT|nr:M56 family metallopeptidase [Draconibacterium halophilum]QIA06366.1 hypothetical protein G0Q07_00835 [Draconibacterium halophilum]